MKARVSRRQVLLASAALVPVAACGGSHAEEAPSGADASAPLADAAPDAPAPDAAPGDGGGPVVLPAGVVIEVSHGGAVVADQVQAAAVRQIMARGMLELTGKTNEEEAWRAFFAPQDVVGIKVSPVGYPKVFSQIATVQEIVRGLGLAGVPNENIVVFDRYKDYLDKVAYAGSLPAGVRFASAVATYTDDQTDLGGYDAAEYVDIARVYPGDDPANPQKRRSFLSQIVSTGVTKIVNVPALKDHISAGVTLALKNSTYGFVNNVSRTHYAPDNWTKDFVPVIAAMSKIRSKLVLHIADALVACYDGGPGPPDPTFKTWNRGALLFATDPVALDRIGWKILDEQRVKMGLPMLADTGIKRTNPGLEAFDERQPQHVLAAGAAGLGVADLAKIQHKIVAL